MKGDLVENDEGENLINDDDKCNDDKCDDDSDAFMSSPEKGNRNKLTQSGRNMPKFLKF